MNLKYIKPLSKFVITSAALSMLFSSSVFGAVKAYANGSSVNVRVGASTEDEVLGKLGMKEAVSVKGKKDDFIKIDYEGTEAFVFEEFITVESDDAFINSDGVVYRINAAKEIGGKLRSGDVLAVTGRFGDYLIFEKNGEAAFVHKNDADCLFKEQLPEISADSLPVTYAKVISDTSLNLRGEPDTGADIVAKLPSGDIVDVIEKGSDWTKVLTRDEQTGYVSSEFVEVKTGIKPEPPAATKGLEVVAYAKQFLGTPYRYGGTSLTSGVDCSGFTYSVYKNFGITLNRTSSSQPSDGIKVAKSDLVAGDLVFFSNGGASNIQHVGIYCGDGTFVHSASGSNMRVMVSGLNESYYVRNYITAARIFN